MSLYGGFSVYRKKTRTGVAVFLSITITSAVIGGGVYFWQNNDAVSDKKVLQQQVSVLQNEVETLNGKLTGSTKEASSVLEKTVEDLKNQNSKLEEQIKELKELADREQKNIIGKTASEVIAAIKNKDFEKLSTFVLSDSGIRFSPYSHVDTKSNLVFNSALIKNIANNKTKYLWGFSAGSGEPISLTFEEYYSKFIYDQDFEAAGEVGYNRIIGRGNTNINVFEVYPKSIVVEYHIPGSDSKYEGMDWKSLRLVFEEKYGKWYLTGIIHDQWTI